MPCSITFTIQDNGKFSTKAKWGDKELPKNIGKFRKLLKNIQTGIHNIDICEAIITYADKALDKKTAKKILKPLINENEQDLPMLFPYEIGKEISDEG